MHAVFAWIQDEDFQTVEIEEYIDSLLQLFQGETMKIPSVIRGKTSFLWYYEDLTCSLYVESSRHACYCLTTCTKWLGENTQGGCQSGFLPSQPSCVSN